MNNCHASPGYFASSRCKAWGYSFDTHKIRQQFDSAKEVGAYAILAYNDPTFIHDLEDKKGVFYNKISEKDDFNQLLSTIKYQSLIENFYQQIITTELLEGDVYLNLRIAGSVSERMLLTIKNIYDDGSSPSLTNLIFDNIPDDGSPSHEIDGDKLFEFLKDKKREDDIEFSDADKAAVKFTSIKLSSERPRKVCIRLEMIAGGLATFNDTKVHIKLFKTDDDGVKIPYCDNIEGQDHASRVEIESKYDYDSGCKPEKVIEYTNVYNEVTDFFTS